MVSVRNQYPYVRKGKFIHFCIFMSFEFVAVVTSLSHCARSRFSPREVWAERGMCFVHSCYKVG